MGFSLKIDSQGGIALSTDQNEIEQAIKIILQTRDRPAGDAAKVWELSGTSWYLPPIMNTLPLWQSVMWRKPLRMWEPRINKLNIVVSPDPTEASRLLIDINFQIKTTNDRRAWSIRST